ncbi:uncharacterized protein E0L32_003869 [Thyridium curvatum]|uniref:Uncharacterized protein n=1 Tax=Thyridium curvatum TaxID=1093900 RepID=A0A507B0F0_9PEZI|nr:uncharacterized protein E0L32_003869 [Thyridium curvatum]TPX16575.1 hypothetical protein E0L32_003869 [Thyridium curvatum]
MTGIYIVVHLSIAHTVSPTVQKTTSAAKPAQPPNPPVHHSVVPPTRAARDPWSPTAAAAAAAASTGEAAPAPDDRPPGPADRRLPPRLLTRPALRRLPRVAAPAADGVDGLEVAHSWLVVSVLSLSLHKNGGNEQESKK